MLAGVVAGSILPESSLPVRALAKFHISDKLQHFGAYYGLAALPALHESRQVLAFIAVLLLALAGGLELGQIYSSGRSFEAADALAGSCGVVAGLLLRFVAVPGARER